MSYAQSDGYPFSLETEIYSIQFQNLSNNINFLYLAGRFLYKELRERDEFQGAAYCRNGIWNGLSGGVVCGDCNVCGPSNCNLTIPTIYTISILPPSVSQPSGLTTTTTHATVTGLLGQGGFLEEFGFSYLSGFEIFNGTNVNTTNPYGVAIDFFSWQLWAILFGTLFFVSIILACIINGIYKCCGCIKALGDDPLTPSESSDV
jgi:hypothetical protein